MSIPLLDLQQCSVRFGGLTAVSAFDLKIGTDDLIGLIGPNGAGKTTVFNVVTGVYHPTAGAITFESASISGLKPSAIARRGIARTFQNIRLFPTLSVFDNVRAGFNLHLRHGLAHALWRMGTFYREENDVARQVRELLEIFDLSKFADALCSSLSYGDQRRLEIVRALATRPKLLLLDEPAAGMNPREKEKLMELINLAVNYGSITALHDVSLNVEKGAIVTLIGANGAGKSTTLRTVSGLLKIQRGSIRYESEEISNLAPHRIVERGISQVPEGRMIFANLTVHENLLMGAYLRKDRNKLGSDFDFVFEIFPRLKERTKQVAGTLSGGEQQMLAIGRALMSKPRCLMLDEPSLGIAPILVKTIFQKIVEINRSLGITVLLVEQNANLALEVSHYGYVLETGRIILHDRSSALRANERVKNAYLGGRC